MRCCWGSAASIAVNPSGSGSAPTATGSAARRATARRLRTDLRWSSRTRLSGDSSDPSDGVVVVAQPPPPDVCPHERLLDGVGGHLAVTAHHGQRPHEAGVVGAEERLDLAAVGQRSVRHVGHDGDHHWGHDTAAPPVGSALADQGQAVADRQDVAVDAVVGGDQVVERADGDGVGRRRRRRRRPVRTTACCRRARSRRAGPAAAARRSRRRSRPCRRR